MKTLRFLSRILLASTFFVCGALTVPTMAHADDKVSPEMIKFLAKFPIDEAWLVKMEKFSAAVAEAKKDNAFAEELSKLRYDNDMDDIVIDHTTRAISKDRQGQLTTYISAKYPKVTALLKSVGWTPWDYCAGSAALTYLMRLGDEAAEGKSLPDLPLLRENVAFLTKNAQRIDKAARGVLPEF